MSKKQFLYQRCTSIIYKLQEIYSSILFRWILHNKSQPLILSHKSAMVFSPHQDDETFGCGGMIALKRGCGVPVKVTFLTDGQKWQGRNSQLKPDELILIRKKEAEAALSILGVMPSEIHFLQVMDGTLQYLINEQRQQIIDQIVQLLQCHKPEEVYVPHRKDWHKDHKATYELVKTAILKSGIQAELLQYPIWLFWNAPLFIIFNLQELAFARRLSIDSVKEKKRQAIKAYHSQLPTLPSGFLKRFFGSFEIFFTASPK
jgi:N-acetylglucosamine malate deacetylase 1